MFHLAKTAKAYHQGNSDATYYMHCGIHYAPNIDKYYPSQGNIITTVQHDNHYEEWKWYQKGPLCINNEGDDEHWYPPNKYIVVIPKEVKSKESFLETYHHAFFTRLHRDNKLAT